MKKLKVLLFSAGWDTGGQGYRIKRAFDRYYPDEFEVRSIHTANDFFHYPSDMIYQAAAAKVFFEAADVLHMRNGLEGLKRLRPEALEGKVGLVCHWHGTRFREEHGRLWSEVDQVGAIQLVSTIDLTILAPNLRWLPSPIDLSEMSTYRANALPFKDRLDPIRVCHSPTNRMVKSTAEIMNSVQLLAKSMPIVLDLLEKRPWVEVLARKAKSDIYFDQLNLGYGNNALEAWAMGIPVIAGAVGPVVQAEMKRVFGDLPFFEARADNLTERLEALATDDGLRAQWGLFGHEHTQRFHDERVVADKLAAIYREAYERTAA